MAANEQVRRSGALTRVAVLDAAERLFAARGYRGTSLEEIGREAGLSRGTPGYFFGSKQRLYGEVLDRILTRAQATLAAASARQDASVPVPELLEEIVAAHLGVLTADPTLVRLIQWETLEGHGQILGAIGAQAHSFVELIQRLAAASGISELDETTATELLDLRDRDVLVPARSCRRAGADVPPGPACPGSSRGAGEDDRRIRPDATRDSSLHACRLAGSGVRALPARLSPISGMACHRATGMACHLARGLTKADPYQGRTSTCLTVSKLPCTVLPFTDPNRYQPRLQRSPLSVEGGPAVIRRHPLRHARRAYLLPALLLAALAAASVAGSARPLAAAAATGLVGAYSFDAGSGTSLADSSGSANNGTLSGPTWTTAGKTGNALSFDGVNDWVTIADYGVARPHQRHDPRSLGEADTQDGDWRTVAFEGARGNGLAYALFSNTSNSRPTGIGRRSARARRSASSVAAHRWPPRPGRTSRRPMTARRCACTSTAPRSASQAVTGAMANSLRCRSASAATRSGPSGSPARSTTSASTTARSRSPRSRAT